MTNYQGVVFASLAYIPRNPDDKGSCGKDVIKDALHKTALSAGVPVAKPREVL